MHNIILSPFKLLLTDKSIPPDIIFFSILLITTPIFLITGPAIPDIFLSLIALYFLIKSFWQGQWHYYKNPIFFGFIIFCIYGVLRSLLSDMPLYSLTNEGSIFYFRYIFFAMGVWYLLDKNPYIPKCFIIISVSCLTLVILDGTFQYFTGTNFFGNESIHDGRLTGFFGKEPIIGRYISFLSIFTFALIYQNFKKTKKKMIFLIFFLVICEVAVFLTGERSALSYIILLTILLVIFVPFYRTYVISSLLVSVIIILGIIQINPTAKSRMFDTTIAQLSQTQYPYLPYSGHHEEHYIVALKMFIDKPIFGIGTNTFRFKCEYPEYYHSAYSCTSHPHNYYFQVLAELGIVGFLFIFAFFVYLLFIGIRQLFFLATSNKSKQTPIEILVFPMVLFIYWWPIIPHMSFYNNWNNVLIMLPLGFFMKNYYGNKNNGYFNKI